MSIFKLLFILAATSLIVGQKADAEAQPDGAIGLLKQCAEPGATAETLTSFLIRHGWRRVTEPPFDKDMVLDGIWSLGELGYAYRMMGSAVNWERISGGHVIFLSEAKRRLLEIVKTREPMVITFDPERSDPVFTKDISLFTMSDDWTTGAIRSCNYFGPSSAEDVSLEMLLPQHSEPRRAFRWFRLDPREDELAISLWQGRRNWNWPYQGSLLRFDKSALLPVFPDPLPNMLIYSFHFQP